MFTTKQFIYCFSSLGIGIVLSIIFVSSLELKDDFGRAKLTVVEPAQETFSDAKPLIYNGEVNREEVVPVATEELLALQVRVEKLQETLDTLSAARFNPRLWLTVSLDISDGDLQYLMDRSCFVNSDKDLITLIDNRLTPIQIKSLFEIEEDLDIELRDLKLSCKEESEAHKVIWYNTVYIPQRDKMLTDTCLKLKRMGVPYDMVETFRRGMT